MRLIARSLQLILPGILLSAIAPFAVVQGWAQVEDASHHIFNLTNADRQQRGLSALRWDEALAQAALAHADRMAGEPMLSHVYPGEAGLTERCAAAGAHFRAIAENIATGPNPPAIENQWMHSPPHRANILDSKMDAIGVAIVERHGTLYAVEDFEQSSQQFTTEQVEKKVRDLLRARGVDPSASAELAEEACTAGRGIPQGSNARSIVRFETPDLGQLPAQVLQIIASRNFRKAAVGACAPGSTQVDFTNYRVAILFY
jgi:uncharacterized protein YkwD